MILSLNDRIICWHPATSTGIKAQEWPLCILRKGFRPGMFIIFTIYVCVIYGNKLKYSNNFNQAKFLHFSTYIYYRIVLVVYWKDERP